MLPHSTAAVVARNELWQGACATEPYEAGWAREIVIFVRTLEASGPPLPDACVEISPDGIHWVAEGTTCAMPRRVGEVTFCRVNHFGNWVRLACTLPEAASAKVLVTLHCK